MAINQLDTPVVLIVFNRPATTLKVLAAIKKVKPKQLFIIADAPRINNMEDIVKCEAVKKIINEEIDWECEVHHRYPDENRGCGRGPSEGISWVFKHVDRAIILEDDCLPLDSFFSFCEDLLERYNHDKRVMMISGNHHLFKKISFDYSYCFSRHTQTWGWATWKRAWELYDYEMKLWPEVKKTGWLKRVMGNGPSSKYWKILFDKCYIEKNRDYWDFQWTFCCISQNALNIIPDRNLVSNIGFGDSSGTHFFDTASPFANLPVTEIAFPLRHPKLLIQNIEVDDQINKDVYGHISNFHRVKRKLRRILKLPI